ncbi:MAG TPA: alpha/beta hydrolase [Candidatus Competibacteraceae bacterium]|nr:alpha/beta hydrolase [Candidatus Competibacteraceae bacterium]
MTTTMTSRYLTCADRELHFAEWGAEHPDAVLCWHGLARTGRDFDALARHLSGRYRVICPDLLGRGSSQWAQEPAREYRFAVFGQMALELCQQLGIERLRWVGTSMGGMLGIILAAGALQDRITHLVLNDVGPEIPPAAARRVAAYVGNPPTVATLTALEQWLRTVYAPFGPQTDATWRHLAETSWRRTDAGQITVHYDPRLVEHLTGQPDDWDQWAAYDRIRCPTLLLRGKTSDVLSREAAEAMTRRGPRGRLAEIEYCGHAPMLNTTIEWRLVDEFLASKPSACSAA